MMRCSKIIVSLLWLWNNETLLGKQATVYSCLYFSTLEKQVSRVVGKTRHGNRQPLQTQSSPPQSFKSVASQSPEVSDCKEQDGEKDRYSINNEGTIKEPNLTALGDSLGCKAHDLYHLVKCTCNSTIHSYLSVVIFQPSIFFTIILPDVIQLHCNLGLIKYIFINYIILIFKQNFKNYSFSNIYYLPNTW